ncbi:PLDc N-terminal domain-containing protein [Jatrophihabitans telluris]|uniref:PLDc N-terminal domain-containing protein n=1 Tax=Jatrophihabitans telluris TaxID=2038343 RepID=A0ABY4QWV4_9ACTN|nr:PLDc N-terminal domain-containing protein [Jatrophihabitans telluris]UQX87301.1 PLDc N-terminal domain-containing protein [Jatrophihabitans telluris]
MLFLDGGAGLILLLLWLFCLIDVITTDADRCRNLPKVVWVLIVVLLFDIGCIAWLVAGHPWDSRKTSGLAYKGNKGRDLSSRYPEYERPGRFAATNPDDDDAFLAEVKARAERQREAYRAQRSEELRREQQRLLGRENEHGDD